MPWPLQRAAANEARLLNLPVVAHGMSLQEITKGVTLGYAMLEHSGFQNYEDVLQMLAAAGTRWDPTIGPVIGYSQLLQERLPSSGYERLRNFFPNVNEQVEHHFETIEFNDVLLTPTDTAEGFVYFKLSDGLRRVENLMVEVALEVAPDEDQKGDIVYFRLRLPALEIS